jgi:prevent-host-death family protein
MATPSYSIFDAKAKLSEILDKVSKGEVVVITRHGQAVAKIVPIVPTGKRDLGFATDEVGFLPGWDERITAEGLIGK